MYNKENKEELSMSRTQRKYDHEYKVQAVKLAREIGGAEYSGLDFRAVR